jgi:hypothetical protein
MTTFKSKASSLEQAAVAIAEMDLGPVKAKLMDPIEGLGWSREKCNENDLIYRRFLYLNAKFSDRSIVPTREIDQFWHAHILDTRKYEVDCNLIFGRFFHHFPYFGMRGEDDRRELDVAFSDTKALFKEEFGYNLHASENHIAQPQSCGSNSCSGQSYSGNCQREGERILQKSTASMCDSGSCYSGCSDNSVSDGLATETELSSPQVIAKLLSSVRPSSELGNITAFL